MKEAISENIRNLYGRIAQACEEHDRDADDITVVAVTKTHPAAVIRTVVAHGIRDIGESRVQEAEPKIREVGPLARFHMVGHLQTNKVKTAVQLFNVIQSVDSLKLAQEIDRHAGWAGRTMECLIEVNCSGEQQKFGVAVQDCENLVREVMRLPHIELAGLMTIGPLTDDGEKIREAFRGCRRLFERLKPLAPDRFDTLSMGMTDDFTLAIAEGSTMVRIGTALFGAREG
jgi:pyridoxal phosphate enzyme (YggS family)